MSFRRLLALLAAAGLVAACDSCGQAPPAPKTARAEPAQAAVSATRLEAPSATASASAGPANAAREPRKELTWVYESTGVGPMQVVVSVPEHRAGQKFPVLITMHGRGEAFKGPAKGARGWMDDYNMGKALDRLHKPPLTGEDFEGLASSERLEKFNAALAKKPYRDLVVVCPYTPDILAGDRPFTAALPLAKFLVDELLPRVRKETPALESSEATGIDGVSLGGRASLLVGFERAEAFGAVASLQAAFDSADAAELARRAKAAHEKNPKLRIRLLTSEGDFYLRANRTISRALSDAGVENELTVIPGPHDYPFNRGPGVYEMLVFHDRALRGESMFD